MLKQHRDPRAKKVKNSTRIRNKFQIFRIPRDTVTVVNEMLHIIDGVDESGYPFWQMKVSGASRTYRKIVKTPKDKGNGACEMRDWRGIIHGKSSRVAMREKADWIEEANQIIRPPKYDHLGQLLLLSADDEYFEYYYMDCENWQNYVTPEKQAEMEAYNGLMYAHEEAFDDIAVYNPDVNEDTWPIGVPTYSRVFQREIILDEHLDFVDAETGKCLLPYPILGEAREQAWVMSLEDNVEAE